MHVQAYTCIQSICMHILTYICMYTYTSIYIHIHIDTEIHEYPVLYMHIHAYVCMYMHMHVYKCICMHLHIYIVFARRNSGQTKNGKRCDDGRVARKGSGRSWERLESMCREKPGEEWTSASSAEGGCHSRT